MIKFSKFLEYLQLVHVIHIDRFRRVFSYVLVYSVSRSRWFFVMQIRISVRKKTTMILYRCELLLCMILKPLVNKVENKVSNRSFVFSNTRCRETVFRPGIRFSIENFKLNVAYSNRAFA